MAGKTLRELGVTRDPEPDYVSAKEVVLPFIKFPGVDIVLGPEMKSTGEVMGIDSNFGAAFAKSQIAASAALPLQGTVFISVRDHDKRNIIIIANKVEDLGLSIMATAGSLSAMGPSSTPLAGSPFCVVSLPKCVTTRRSRALVVATYSSRRISLSLMSFSRSLSVA